MDNKEETGAYVEIRDAIYSALQEDIIPSSKISFLLTYTPEKKGKGVFLLQKKSSERKKHQKRKLYQLKSDPLEQY